MSNAVRAQVEELAARRDIWDRFPVGLALWSEPGRLVYVNPTLLQWLERTEAEVVGCTVEEAGALGMALGRYLDWHRVRQGDYETPLALTAESARGSPRYLEVHLFRCLDEAGRFTGALEIVLDRTHRYVAERYARLAIAGEVAAAIAHEMKNHLTAALGYTELIERFLDGRGQPHLRHLRRQLTVLSEHARRLLAYGRRHEASGSPAELQQVLVSAMATVTPYAASRGVYLDVALPSQSLCVRGDPARLEQVFVNLLLNAVEASRAGDTVTVSVAAAEDTVEVTVRDRGPGMKPEVLQRVGEPFFTTKREGFGLGVYLSREILAEYGGRLTYRSQPGQGTEARVSLPVVRVSPHREGSVLA